MQQQQIMTRAEWERRERRAYKYFSSSDREPLKKLFRIIVSIHYEISYYSFELHLNMIRIRFSHNGSGKTYHHEITGMGYNGNVEDQEFIKRCYQELDNYLACTDPATGKTMKDMNITFSYTLS